VDPSAWPLNGLLQGRYRIRDVIGRGGMGAVFRAHDQFLGRDVAVKIFAATANEVDFHRQEEEVNVLASLNHHSLVTLLDAAVDRTQSDRPRIYFVMELVEGTDLKRRLASDEALTPREVAEIGYDLAEGLQYMHHRGVVHRDIKPANILMVDYQDENNRARAKLTDFGVAVRANTERSTDAGQTTGTAAYLSPEQVEQGPVVGASDVYSLGLVLLECFTGVVAFPGDPIPSAIARLRHDPEIPDELDEEWRRLLSAMTARHPENRPSADQLVHALRQLVIAETGRHRFDFIDQDEQARLDIVRRYDVLDTPPDDAFDRITAIAARVLEAPIALVTIVDEDRIWFKSHHGLDLLQIDRDPGLCSSAVMQGAPWVVEDARFDPRTLANPLVAGSFGLQFYVGVPLTTREGYNLGTLCVLDFEPRTVSQQQIATLEDLAAMVMNELEAGRQRSGSFPPTQALDLGAMGEAR
jgi:serine/threonine protein kinase